MAHKPLQRQPRKVGAKPGCGPSTGQPPPPPAGGWWNHPSRFESKAKLPLQESLKLTRRGGEMPAPRWVRLPGVTLEEAGVAPTPHP